jgi:hypothetical protein
MVARASDTTADREPDPWTHPIEATEDLACAAASTRPGEVDIKMSAALEQGVSVTWT